MARSYCPSCDKTFTSVSAFDMHRGGSYGDAIYKDEGNRSKVIGHTRSTRHCLNEAEMSDKGMIKNERGLWCTGMFDASTVFGKKPEEEEEDR